MSAPLVLLISGLGETAWSDGNGLSEMCRAINLANPGIMAIRLAWFNRGEGLRLARGVSRLLLVGHSFGGQAACDIARDHAKPCDMVLIDPVPTSFVRRWWPGVVMDVPENVAHATCFLRRNRAYPRSKPIPERTEWTNLVVPRADHNSIVRTPMVRDAILVRARSLVE